jgi:hypothetical protein
MRHMAAGQQFRTPEFSKFSSMCHGFPLARNIPTGNTGEQGYPNAAYVTVGAGW